MDSPQLAPAEHRRALAGLVQVNRISRTAPSLLPHVLRLARDLHTDRLTLLDVACGGGDVPLRLRQMAAAHGVQLDLVLADKSSVALEQARSIAPAIQTVQCDALDDRLPHADIVTNSLFLHHLDAPEVIRTLAHFASRARHLLLVSDLVRSASGWLIAWGACRALSISPVMRHDGPVSVRAAWTREEMREMCRAAGLEGATVRRAWPWRMLISWRRETA